MTAPHTGLSAARLALAVKRRLDEENGAPLTQSDPIAIIGIGCRFPGNVRTLDDYWDLLLAKTDTIREAPASRWSVHDWFDEDAYAPGKTNGRFGSFLDDPDAFDPAFFGLAPREAPYMDPQHRLLLEVTWEALWEAGIAPHSLAGSRTGVFMALCNTDYSRLLLTDPYAIGPNSLTGASHSIASGRISYLLDLQGPSVSLDTACSSSLIAVHLACQSLRSGETSLAIAGGVTLHLTHEHYVALAKLGMLAPDGRCKTFDSRADGFVPGEGSGVIVLKRLADALADGDQIHAVIRGTASTQDGRTTVLTAPNGLAQQAAVRAALENARISPDQVGYVETHGTGTALGDPIEVEALSEVLGGTTPCALGSVKTNLGHLEAAAGIAGLIKATLALEREQIPPNLHFEQLNPHISLDGTQFFVPVEPYTWKRGTTGRFAGVSSFGFGGTNAHVVLEEAPRVPPTSPSAPDRAYVLPISARDPEALTELARRYRNALTNVTDHSIGDLCQAAAVRRSHYEERIAVTATSADTLRAAFDDLLAGKPRPATSRGSAVEAADVVFVCSGQGSQWPKMGVRLLTEFDVYRETIEACDTIVREHAGWSLLDELNADETSSRLNHTEYAQPAIVATEIALAKLWESWGVVPTAVIGHSVGEIAAAHIAGAIDLDEAMRIVLLRGRLMEGATGTGRMAAAAISPDDAQRDITRFGDDLSLAAVNSPASIVISGTPTAVEALTAEWTKRGVSCRALPVDYAFHSKQVDPFRNALVDALGEVATHPSAIPMISTVTGSVVSGTALDASYWGRNMRQTVLLSDALRTMIDQGVHTFVEVGPHAVLSVSVQECLAAAGQLGLVQPSLRRNQDERTTLLGAVGALYANGASVNWAEVYPGLAPIVPLPVYPYQRKRYWIQRSSNAVGSTNNGMRGGAVDSTDVSTGRTQVERSNTQLRPLLARRIFSPLLKGVGYEVALSTQTHPFLADHRIGGALLFPLTGFLEMALEAIIETKRWTSATLTDVVVQHPLVVPETGARTVQIFLEGAQFRIFSLDGEEWTLHASGQFTEHSVGDLQREIISATSKNTTKVGAYYQRLSEHGAQFGPSFRTVTELSADDTTATAVVQLDPSVIKDTVGYQIHPALLDGCFQPVLATSASGNDGVWVPIAIDQFTAITAANAAARSYLTTRSNAGTNDILTADVRITDTQGNVVVAVEGLRCKRLHHTRADQTARFRYHVEWKKLPVLPQTATEVSQTETSKSWLVVAESTTLGDQLRQILESRGTSCVVTSSTELTALPNLSFYRGIIHLDTLASELTETFERGCTTTLSIVQSLARYPGPFPEIWIATQGACAVTPDDQLPGFAQSVVLGLARTVTLEHPDFACRTVDLDPTLDLGAALPRLADELLSRASDQCVALRASERYTPRLVPESVHPQPADESPRRLVIDERGTLDNLRFETLERRTPGRGQVEVSVEASSLNFRDVLNALGMYPGEAGALGAEFAGTVVRVGDDVQRWTPGDRVMGIAWGSFANYVVTDAHLLTAIPDGLDTITAATIPNAYLTAHHCLIRIARLTRGDRVLIHAGAGGVGMAAIHLAKHVGAEIFSTAGSPEKRAYLEQLGVHHVLDSRSLDFSGQILERTEGRGVDLVLNSLSGDFIRATFAATAPNGRFVEIGKIGIWSDAQVAELGKNIDYTVVDLSYEIDHAPEVLGEQLHELTRLVAERHIPPLPARVFAFDDARAAFRYMAQARQIGRVILKLNRGISVTPNATYLITGGLGGIGLRIARWLAEQGATHVVLVSRSAPSADVQATIDEIEALGTSVSVRRGDISKESDVAALVQAIGIDGPALRGIVHAAGIVDDGVLVHQTWERFARVFAPKVYGAWHLHRLTRDLPLDFFVLCSSVSALFGAPGQGAYASANAFLDTLAARRQAEGSPALSINWGAWADVGMAARVEAEGKRRVLAAIRPMSPDDCVACIEPALQSGRAQIAVVDAQWSEWIGPVPSMLTKLTNKSTVSTATAQNGAAATTTAAQLATAQEGAEVPSQPDIAQQLASAPASARRGMLVAMINTEARRVLGLSDTHPIDERQSLLKMGLDSLMAVELRNRLAASLRQPLPATLLFDHPSAAALADAILGILIPAANTDTRDAGSIKAEASDDLLQDIAAMSDEEAEQLLARELGGLD